MREPYNYLRDGAAIYERSFAIIRSEADLARFSDDEAVIAVRMIHACGLVEAARQITFAPDFVAAARTALDGGAPILCDAEMVAHGVTRTRLPAHNDVVCTLRDARVPALATQLGTTRSAAALELWRDRLAGADPDPKEASAVGDLAHDVGRANALTAAAVMALPPRRPRTIRNGMLRAPRASASFDSAAPTNPTGVPMIAAGRGAPASSISSK